MTVGLEPQVLLYATGAVYHLPEAAEQCAAVLAMRAKSVEPTVSPLPVARSRGFALCSFCNRYATAPDEQRPALAPRVTITYCTQCQWLLRAAWMAQELLSTFAQELGEVALVPGTGGVFTVTVDNLVVWDRKAEGGFPDVTTLKQRVRDEAAPERHLGHADRRGGGRAAGPG